MSSWNWNILETNLALMSSTHFNCCSFSQWNQMHAFLLFWLFSFVYSLQNYVRTACRSFNRNHFQLEIVADYHPRKSNFTNLALELVKVVSTNDSINFFFNFTVNPLLKTVNMNNSTMSFACTWRYQKILISILLTETDFTWSLFYFVYFKDAIKIPQKEIGEILLFLFRQSSNLNNLKLDPSYFKDIASPWISKMLLNGNPLSLTRSLWPFTMW